MKYDHVIIGAGSAGAILACRLSEDPDRSVLLLEAGPDYPDLESLPEDVRLGYGTRSGQIATSNVWEFEARGTDAAPSLQIVRGKITGGSSAVNVQIFLRGLPEDYDAWASLGNDEWGYEKVLPYLRKLETDQDFHDDFHGTEGPIVARRFSQDEMLPAQLAFHEACRKTGFPECQDHNNPDSTGVGPTPLNNLNGVRFSTALGYLSQSRHRLNLTTRPDCLVRRIMFDGNRAVGVEVESGGERFTVEGDEIILSAGAVGSPHLLLLSGVGPAGNLRPLEIPLVYDLPGVGQNLRDHPAVHVAWQADEDLPMDIRDPWVQTILRYTSGDSDLRNDMIMFFVAAAYLSFIDAERIIVMRPSINLAMGAGELRLASSDPKVQPMLDFNYFDDEFDRRRMREAVRLCLKIGEQEAFKDILGERVVPGDDDVQSDDALDDWILSNVATGEHISCTCKMGPASDPMAVVDQYGKVHGLERLRVVDASIMPNCPRANLNVTTMMIGERVADFIQQGK